jgi:hypothetical protein
MIDAGGAIIERETNREAPDQRMPQMEERKRKATEGNKHSHMASQRNRTHLHGPEKHPSYAEIPGIDRYRQQDIGTGHGRKRGDSQRRNMGVVEGKGK